MTTRKMFTILLVANLLTVALVTVAFQTGGIVAASPASRTAGDLVASVWDQYLYPQVPRQMSYQGVLRDASGNPINGTHNLTFKIWACDPCTTVWSETHSSVSVTNGLFSVILGETDLLDPGDFKGYGPPDWDHLYLSVSVDGGPELQPLPRLISVPYAFRAEYVNRFPAPHYDSGWQEISLPSPPVDTCQVFNHNLGGNSDDYIVDVQFKSGGTDGVNQIAYGGDHDDIAGSFGASWSWLDNTRIRICRRANDTDAKWVRIRIWRIE